MNFLKIKLLVIAVIMFTASSAFASLSYNYTVDTSSVQDTDGYLYFQFTPNPGISLLTAPGATATINNFSITSPVGVAGSLFAVKEYSAGSVQGSLNGGSVTMSNTLQLNDYLHVIHFGDTLAFNLVLDGLAVTNPNGIVSTFSLTLTSDFEGLNPLLTSNGVVVVQETPTPIPAAAWLLGSGLLGLVGIRRRKK